MNASAVAWQGPALRRSRPWQAFGSALGLEFVVLAAVVAWIAAHPPQPLDTFVPLTIEVTPEPEPVAPPELVKPVTPVPPPRLPKPVAVQPEPKPLPPEPIAPTVAPLPQPVATPAPTAFTAPVPAPRVIVPTAPSVDPALAYNVKLAAAVQAAFTVPAPAAALNFKGRTRVEFGLRDGVASAIRVVQSSGLGAADRAAIKAVETATFPAPPPSLQGKDGSYQIWVACL